MSRINPLRPAGRRTVSLETKDSHHEIENFKLLGKREAYRRRNESYVKSMYGSPVQKEQVRRDNRISLQRQIREHDNNHQQHLAHRYKESDYAINYDQACINQDREARVNREAYLKQFRDENKRLMELQAEKLKKERESAHLRESKLLSLSPINWSKTLH